MILSKVQKQRKLFFHEKSMLWLLLEEGFSEEDPEGELLGHWLVHIQIWYLLPKSFPKWLLLINFLDLFLL